MDTQSSNVKSSTEEVAQIHNKMGSIEFESWAAAKYEEVKKSINVCDEGGNIDPIRLNHVLVEFSGNFAWAITIQEVESNKLSILEHEYDSWSKKIFSEAYRVVREEHGGIGRAPSQAVIEARVVDMYEAEIAKRTRQIEMQKSRVELLRGFVKVLDRQASILQTISSNMRSELFYSASPVVRDTKVSNTATTNVAKVVLKRAMNKATDQGTLEEQT